MSDHYHSFFDDIVHVFEHVGILVRMQAKIVSANACVFRTRVLAVSKLAEDIVLDAGDIRDVRPGWRLGRNRLFRGLLLSGRA